MVLGQLSRGHGQEVVGPLAVHLGMQSAQVGQGWLLALHGRFIASAADRGCEQKSEKGKNHGRVLRHRDLPRGNWISTITQLVGVSPQRARVGRGRYGLTWNWTVSTKLNRRWLSPNSW